MLSFNSLLLISTRIIATILVRISGIIWNGGILTLLTIVHLALPRVHWISRRVHWILPRINGIIHLVVCWITHWVEHWITVLSLVVRQHISVLIVLILVIVLTILTCLVLITVHRIVPLVGLRGIASILISHRIVVSPHWIHPLVCRVASTHSIIKLWLSVLRTVVLHSSIRCMFKRL